MISPIAFAAATPTPSRKPTRGVFHLRVHYPSKGNTPPDAKDLTRYAEDMTDNFEKVLTTSPEEAKANEWKGQSPKDKLDEAVLEKDAEAAIDALEEVQRRRKIPLGSKLHQKLWNSFARLDKNYAENRDAFVSAASRSSSTPTTKVFTLLTGKLATQYKNIIDKRNTRNKAYTDAAFVFDEDAEGCKWVPLDEVFWTDKQHRLIPKLKARVERAEQKHTTASQKVNTYIPSATIDIRAKSLDSIPKVTITRTKIDP